MGMEARISAVVSCIRNPKARELPLLDLGLLSLPPRRACIRCFAAPHQHKPILIYMREENLSGELIPLNDVFLSKLAAFPWEIWHDMILWGSYYFWKQNQILIIGSLPTNPVQPAASTSSGAALMIQAKYVLVNETLSSRDWNTSSDPFVHLFQNWNSHV